MVQASQKHRGRNALGGVVGNVLEWYDFAVFGFFAPVIGRQFFPSDNELASLLAAFGAFAGAYLARPVGGILFGQLGDRRGRKQALQTSVLLMGVCTLAIGLLPTHEQVGLVAPVLLLLLRVAQGLSVGGELVSSVSFATEIAPPHRRGWYGSWAFCSVTAGIALGSAVAAAITWLLSQSSVEAWGWRLPFLAGIGIGWFGLWMRRGMVESPHFVRAGAESNPVATVMRTQYRRVFLVTALVLAEGAGFYLFFVWWPVFMTELVRPPLAHALWYNLLAMGVLIVLTPVMGALSDVFGRKSMLVFFNALLALAAGPLFSLLAQGSWSPLAVQVFFAVLISGLAGPLPAALAEMFPTEMRVSGIGIGYNLALAFFGGTAPLVCTWLVATTQRVEAPAYYLAALALVSLVAAITADFRYRGERFGPGRSRSRRSLVVLPPPPAAPPGG
jgi:MHS family proline/betaine transporter-like MFS transporter